MSKIAYDGSPSQELFIQFLIDPDSMYAGLLFQGLLVNAPAFKSSFNRSEFFDLSQDPLVLDADAFVKKWPWLKNSTNDINIIKYPDTESRPGNPHNIAQIMLCFVLSPGVLARVRDGQLYTLTQCTPDPPVANQPHLHLVPPRKKPALPKASLDKVPQDVLDKINAKHPSQSFLAVYSYRFRLSWCGSSAYLFNWHEKEHRDSRWSHQGIKSISKSLGLGERTIKRADAWLLHFNFMYRIHRGYPGEGNSEYELPKDMSTVKVFRHKKAMQTILKIGRQK